MLYETRKSTSSYIHATASDFICFKTAQGNSEAVYNEFKRRKFKLHLRGLFLLVPLCQKGHLTENLSEGVFFCDINFQWGPF